MLILFCSISILNARNLTRLMLRLDSFFILRICNLVQILFYSRMCSANLCLRIGGHIMYDHTDRFQLISLFF